ncbi:MAG TPA: ribbon-helix-helix protein, CopG family [Steroidobacteraceae bacterium]
MTARKTFSLPDDLAQGLEREAARQGRDQSAIVRDGIEMYLASQQSPKLDGWVGKGRSKRPVDHEALHEELAEVLERKHGDGESRRKPAGS